MTCKIIDSTSVLHPLHRLGGMCAILEIGPNWRHGSGGEADQVATADVGCGVRVVGDIFLCAVVAQ